MEWTLAGGALRCRGRRASTLFTSVDTGKTHESASLCATVEEAGRHTTYFEMRFKNVVPNSLVMSGAGTGLPVVSASFNDVAVLLRHRPQESRSGFGDRVEGSYNLKTKSADFEGDPTAFVGRFLAGGNVPLDALPVSPPVPEPASWALMAGGLALVAGLSRRRRQDRD